MAHRTTTQHASINNTPPLLCMKMMRDSMPLSTKILRKNRRAAQREAHLELGLEPGQVRLLGLELRLQLRLLRVRQRLPAAKIRVKRWKPAKYSSTVV